jgi:hypothetical protein
VLPGQRPGDLRGRAVGKYRSPLSMTITALPAQQGSDRHVVVCLASEEERMLHAVYRMTRTKQIDQAPG